MGFYSEQFLNISLNSFIRLKKKAKHGVLMHPSLFFQYHKHGKDIEKVKQRMAEIANYVDKV